MTVNLSMLAGAGFQFLDNNGDPLTGGKVYTYLAGSTTPVTTYTTNAGTTAHTNPIVLDAAGRVPSGGEIWLTNGVSHKFVVKTSTEVELGSYDNIRNNIGNIYSSLSASDGSSLVGYQPLSGAATTVQEALRSIPGFSKGTFTLSTTSTKIVSNVNVKTTSIILLSPTNTSAATLMQGAGSLYISAKVADTSFTVATANGSFATGTETFDYVIIT